MSNLGKTAGNMARVGWPLRPLSFSPIPFFLFAMLLVLLVGTTPLSAQDEEDAAEAEPAAKAQQENDEPVTAIVGATLHTMGDAGTLEAATLLIRGEKIAEVGRELEIPEGARVIDAAGMIITPGLIDLRSTLGLTSAAAGDSGRTAALDAVDGLDPYQNDWREVARQGITAVYVQPAPQGSLGGFGALLRVAPAGGSDEALVISERAGFQSSLGVASFGRSSKARLSEFTGLKKRFEDAKKYGEAWEKYRAYQAKQKKDNKKEKDADKKDKKSDGDEQDAGDGSDKDADGKGAESEERGDQPKKERPTREASSDEEDKPEDKKDADAKSDDATGKGEKDDKEKEKPPEKPDFDPLKERLLTVLEGEVPLRMEVHRADDVRRALELADEYELTVILEGLSDLGSRTESVLEAGLPIVLGPWSDDARQSYQSSQRVPFWAETFADYPGRMAIASFSRSGRGSKMLRFEAARAIAAGVSRDVVMRGLTRVPAEISGAGDTLGMLAPDYQADVAIFAGDPLDPATPVYMTFSAGEVTYEKPRADKPVVAKVTEAVSESGLPEALPSAYAIRSARLLGADGSFAPGSVVVRDGKIDAVHGADAELAELPIYDVGDAVVTPGLVTAHATLNPSAVRDTQGVVDSGSLRAADTFDPDAAAVKELSAGGFLRAGHAPGDSRVIAGPLAEVRLGAAEPIVAPQIAEKIVFSNEARSRERFPASLAGQQLLLRESLAADGAPLPLYLPQAALAVLDDARAARRQSLSSGERPMLIRAENDAEVVAVIKLVRELDIRATLLGPDELRATADFLGEAGIGIVSRPLRASDFDWFTADLAAAIEAGAALGFAGGDPLEIRRTAAALVQQGVAPQTVLLGLTHGGARLVGMSEGAGQLRAGQPADLVLWSGSPLELTARPLAVLVDGKRLPTEK